jgi:hypothetical protein
MNFNIFSIYDQKAKAYLPPFILPNEAMAVRTFSDCVNSKEHQFGAHPEDYTLFNIGDFDDSQGSIKQKTPHLVVATGLELLDEEPATAQLQLIGENENG